MTKPPVDPIYATNNRDLADSRAEEAHERDLAKDPLNLYARRDSEYEAAGRDSEYTDPAPDREDDDSEDEADDDPQCVCGTYRSEHAAMPCPEGFQTKAQWAREHAFIVSLEPDEFDRIYHPDGY